MGPKWPIAEISGPKLAQKLLLGPKWPRNCVWAIFGPEIASGPKAQKGGAGGRTDWPPTPYPVMRDGVPRPRTPEAGDGGDFPHLPHAGAGGGGVPTPHRMVRVAPLASLLTANRIKYHDTGTG